MATREEAKRAFQIVRASARKKKLQELALAVVLGLVCSAVIGLIIYLLNRRSEF